MLKGNYAKKTHTNAVIGQDKSVTYGKILISIQKNIYYTKKVHLPTGPAWTNNSHRSSSETYQIWKNYQHQFMDLQKLKKQYMTIHYGMFIVSYTVYRRRSKDVLHQVTVNVITMCIPGLWFYFYRAYRRMNLKD